MVKNVTQEEFRQEAAAGISVVDFYADWCGPCQMMGPVVEAVSDKFPDIKFFKINTDENIEIAQENRIMSIPAICIFKDGKFVNMSVGFVVEDQLVDFIKENI